MINEVRNSVGFRDFASAKKQRARAPYSATFQPLLTEVEPVDRADLIEPYSVEQTLHDINEELEEHDAALSEDAVQLESDEISLDGIDAIPTSVEPTQLYAGTGHMVAPTTQEEEPAQSAEIDDDTIVKTLVSDIAAKIDSSFQQLELNIQEAVEKRLGQAMLTVFKQQMAVETSDGLKQAITKIIGDQSDLKVTISGPAELIETFQNHMDDQGDQELNLSFSVNETSTDLIVQIDETSIASRFGELDDLVSELFE